MPRVTSRDNPRLNEALRLIASSRDRRKSGRCVLEGEHLVGVYRQRFGAPERLIVVESALARPALQALVTGVPTGDTLIVGDALWTELTSLPLAIGILAVVPAPKPTFHGASDFCVLLEDMQDPGNVGSVLRSAAAAGVAQVFMSPHCAFAWSPKVLRAAQGAHFHLEIFEGVDLIAWARDYRGALIATVAADGEPLYRLDLRGPVAFAVGNEGAGLSGALRTLAVHRAMIPMPGGFESLNAAAAAAICLFECVRQRLRPARSSA